MKDVRPWAKRLLANRILRGSLGIGSAPLRPIDPPSSRLRRGDRKTGTEETREDLKKMARDIKEPLTVIENYAELLLEDADSLPPEERRDVLNRIAGAAREAMMLAVNVLDAAKIEAGPLEPARKPVDLTRLVKHVFGHEARFAKANGVDLAQDIDASVPAVEGDEILFDRVFANLVHDSLQHAARGSTVRLRAALKGGVVKIIVEEVGEKTLAQTVDELVDEYLNDSRRVDPVNLGLYIARTIVESHAGMFSVEKPVDGGAWRFHVTLPAPR